MGFGGGGVTEKKNGLKGGGHVKKNKGKGGSVKHFSSALTWDTLYYS